MEIHQLRRQLTHLANQAAVKSLKNTKKKQSSSSSASSNSNSQNNNQQNNQSQNNSATNNSQQEQTTQNPTQSANNDPTQSGDIHSFVNQYGVSPALYKMQHYGMSQQQALDSTPDNMKTSGELQIQHQMEGQ